MDASPPPAAPPPAVPKARRGAELLRIARELGVLLGVVAMLWGAFGWFRAPELPAEAPHIGALSLAGTRVGLDDHRGKVVVLNFWATWCGPCQLEMPELIKFSAANPEVPVLFLAVDGTTAELNAFAKRMGLPLDRVVRLDEATLQAYGVTTLPTTVVVNREGRVRTAFTGMVARPWLWLWTR